jgi:hypothetical protein
MRKRRLIFFTMGVGAALIAAGLLKVSAGTGPGDIFRSLHTLRALLNSETASGEIESIAESLGLWRVVAEIVPAAPEEGCLPLEESAPGGEKMRLRLEFANQDRRSSRVYALDFVACETAPDEFRFTMHRAGFATDSHLERQPITADRNGLKILRLALNEPAVFGRLEELRESLSLDYLRIRRESCDEQAVARYSFIAAQAPPLSSADSGTFPPGTGVVAYDVLFDQGAGTALFELR